MTTTHRSEDAARDDRTPEAATPGLAGPLAAPRRALRRALARPLAVPFTTTRWAAGVGLAGLRHLRRLPHIERVEAAVGPVPAPPQDLAGDPGPVQRREDGSGPLHHRVYRVRIRDAAVDAAGLMDRMTGSINAVAPTEIARWEKTRGPEGLVRVGDEYVVHLAGPWEGPVRVVARDATSFTVVTLRGHMEAGENTFRTRDEDGLVVFEVETWSRCGDPLLQLLYEPLAIAREVQLLMWTHVCERMVALAGGRREGPIRVETATLREGA